MAISKSFAGRNINVPGAYSESKTDNSAGGAIESNDTIFLLGESSKGKPGDVEGVTEWSNAQLNQLIEYYGSGPIVDCAMAASRPTKTPGIGGAGKFLVWKTNSTLQASVSINEATDSDELFVVKDRAWGREGNDLSITIVNGTGAQQKLITIKKLNDTAESLGENDGLAGISIQYTGDATTGVAAISGLTQLGKQLIFTLAGDQTDGSVDLTIDLKNYTLKGLVDYINLQTGYAATLVTNAYAAKKGYELDAIASGDVKTAAVSLYRNQYELLEVLNESKRVEAVINDVPRIGLTVNVADAFLTGGAQGASVNLDFSDGLSKSLAELYNVALACISRDASDDIADSILGFTDAGSTYDIASVLTAVESHMRLRTDVESRKEAQAFGGIRKAAKADVYQQAGALGSELIQLCMRDIYDVDQLGNLRWMHPHVEAAKMAGIRLGTDVGEPLTHKVISVVASGHFVDPETGLEGGDFNADLDKKLAIDAGVTFTEKVGSVFRIVVDNTTYGTDASFVFNRGSVMEAAQFVAKDIRGVAESVFIGQKVSNGAARSIKNVIRNRLIELNQPDVNIITASSDAPQGFVEETFVVEVEGNTARVQVEVKPVQGLDFIFITFTLGDITQSA